MFAWLSGLFAGMIRTRVFRLPLSNSSSDSLMVFLLVLPLLLLAVLVKKVESNVTAVFDETL